MKYNCFEISTSSDNLYDIHRLFNYLNDLKGISISIGRNRDEYPTMSIEPDKIYGRFEETKTDKLDQLKIKLKCFISAFGNKDIEIYLINKNTKTIIK